MNAVAKWKIIIYCKFTDFENYLSFNIFLNIYLNSCTYQKNIVNGIKTSFFISEEHHKLKTVILSSIVTFKTKMMFLNTLRLILIFSSALSQLPNTNEVLIGKTFTPFTPLPNVVLSDSVSAFVSTTAHELKDKGIVAPLYKLQKTREEIQHGYFNRSYQTAVSFGYTDPASYATKMLQLTKSFQPNTNYELEINAGAYVVGQFLEDQGLLPDVNTAVEKAHEFVNTIESYANEVSPDRSWGDYFGALSTGSVSFLKSNGLTTLEQFKFIRNGFFNQLPTTAP